MTANVEPEEAQALLGNESERQRGDVEARDFAVPRRLSARRLYRIQRDVRERLKRLEQELKSTLRETHTLALNGLSESSAVGLFDELAIPFAMTRFSVDGQPGWIQWEVAAAIQTIEMVLGAAEPQASSERKLSHVESKVLQQILETVVKAIGSVCSVEIENLFVVDQLESVGTWEDVSPNADPQRLVFDIEIEGPCGKSSLTLYMPGIVDSNVASRTEGQDLPSHLDGIPVKLSALLGSIDVPLAELLRLEVGDVIPLTTRVDEPLGVSVDGRVCATAQLGSKNGALAIRIEDWVAERDRA